jgi:hypothetical protein
MRIDQRALVADPDLSQDLHGGPVNLHASLTLSGGDWLVPKRLEWRHDATIAY